MLEISPQIVIFSLVNFLILLVLMRIFLYKPVRKMLDTRQETISESLAAAEKAKNEAASAGEEISARIEQGRVEAEGLVAAARVAGDEQKKQLLDEARKEAQAITESARAAVAKEREEAILVLRQEAASLAVSAAGKLLAEEMSAEQQTALLQKYITKVGQMQ